MLREMFLDDLKWEETRTRPLIRLFFRHPVLDVIRLVYHRPDFYCPQRLTHEVMRGPSSWSIGDRELTAAFTARSNECEWCIGAHTALATKAYGHEVDIAAITADLEHVPIPEALRATLRLLRKLVREKMLTAADVRAAREKPICLLKPFAALARQRR